MKTSDKLTTILSWAPHLSPSEILIALHLAVAEGENCGDVPMTLQSGAAATGAHEYAIGSARKKMLRSGLLRKSALPNPGTGARLHAYGLNWAWSPENEKAGAYSAPA